MSQTKLLLAAAIAVASMAAATSANAAVTINIAQVGVDILLSATGTFDRSLGDLNSDSNQFDQLVVGRYGYVGFGTRSAIDNYSMEGHSGFGSGFANVSISENTGTGLYLDGQGGGFGIARDYASNAQIGATGKVSNRTLSLIGLTSGIYNYTVGGNAVTVNIGQDVGAAVPEPATWAMMTLGFGLVGGAMRRRKTSVAFA